MNDILQRDVRLDLAKFIAISLVMFWHLQPIRISTTEESNILTKILKMGITQINMQITLIAVPVFLLVSLYLFYKKNENQTLQGMVKRCIRISKAFIFWSTCQFAIFFGIVLLTSSNRNIGIFSLSLPTYRLIMEGGPPLPIVGGSVFYFLFVLLILVLLSTGFYLLRNMGKLFHQIGILSIIVSVIYFEILSLTGQEIPYWRIDNFVIYIPLSYFLLQQEGEKLDRYIPFLYAGYVLFSVHDVFLRGQGYNHGAYSRVSIVFGSVALFGSILKLKNLNINTTFITFFSKYSLGIFATHKYWLLIVTVIVHYNGFSIPTCDTNFPLDLCTLGIAIVTTVMTFCGVWLGDRTFLKKYIS